MPVGAFKNTIYGLALPLLGKRCLWQLPEEDSLAEALYRHHVVGACVQRFQNGVLTGCSPVGYARLEDTPCTVTPETVFRSASIAKMVTALLVMRLQTRGLLDVEEELSAFWGCPIRNPHHPEARITLGMLLSHTSSIVDSPGYFDSFQKPVPFMTLLKNPQSFSDAAPGTAFRYSNFAAGLIACLLEKRFGESLEALAQRELFQPLSIEATYDIRSVQAPRLANSYRVFPAGTAFLAKARQAAAAPVVASDPEHHYLLASGSLYLTATALAKLALTACNGQNGFLDAHSLQQMQTPLLGWPQQAVPMRHGMGLLKLMDERICAVPLWGHQGFAYGAVNGVFFDAQGNGFAMLCSGASERRIGHLAYINRDLIRLLWQR